MVPIIREYCLLLHWALQFLFFLTSNDYTSNIFHTSQGWQLLPSGNLLSFHFMILSFFYFFSPPPAIHLTVPQHRELFYSAGSYTLKLLSSRPVSVREKGTKQRNAMKEEWKEGVQVLRPRFARVFSCWWILIMDLGLCPHVAYQICVLTVNL